MFYLNYTVQAWKDDVLLFERDCELGIDYDLPDGRRGVANWDIVEFHFADNGKYTKVTRTEPLFKVLYADVDREWIDEQLHELLANDGQIDRYAGRAAQY